MVSVAELGQVPGKSMHALENVEALEFCADGLVLGDRKYMWVEAEPYTYERYKVGRQVVQGNFISQREDPKLTGIYPTLSGGGLELSFKQNDQLFIPEIEDVAENRIPVVIWDWSGEAIDQGDEAADWGRAHIGRPVRLVAVSEEKPRCVENNESLGRVGFADGFAITVGSTTALETINNHLISLGKNPMPVDRTRATIIFDGLEVLDEGFPEDFVKTITLVNNGLILVLERWKACSRCPIPDTDQTTGERSKYTRISTALGDLGRAGKHENIEKYGANSGLFLTQNFVVHGLIDAPKDAVFKLTKDHDTEVIVEYSDETNWIRNAA